MEFSLVLQSTLFQRPCSPAPGPEGLSDRCFLGEGAWGAPCRRRRRTLRADSFSRPFPTVTAAQAVAASDRLAAKELVKFYT